MSSIKCFFLISLLGSFVYWVRKTFNHQLIVIVMRQSSHLLQNHKRVLFCPVISQQQETTALHGTGFLSTACAHKSSFVLEIPSAKNMNIKDEKELFTCQDHHSSEWRLHNKCWDMSWYIFQFNKIKNPS